MFEAHPQFGPAYAQARAETRPRRIASWRETAAARQAEAETLRVDVRHTAWSAELVVHAARAG